MTTEDPKWGLKEKAEEATAKLKEKLKHLGNKPPVPGVGLHVDPQEVAQNYDSHTSTEGRPPIGGAQDD